LSEADHEPARLKKGTATAGLQVSGQPIPAPCSAKLRPNPTSPATPPSRSGQRSLFHHVCMGHLRFSI